MRILVTGATGLVGSRLAEFLESQDHTVVRLSRSRGDVIWNPAQNQIDREGIEGCDAVVHLAGESIAEGRWNDAKKKRIRDSRINGTHLLAEALANLTQKPKVLVCASAIGYYGDRGDEALTETADPGKGFLPETCVQWEHACEPARRADIRTVNLRIGVVLAREGGALAKMLTPFKLGVGGVLGPGTQYMSWVDIDDLIHIIDHAIHTEQLHGPVNAVSPNPVTNRQFTKTLGHVLKRPTIFPMPAFAARLAFGEMADDLLLASTRVIPKQLETNGYAFRHAHLEDSMRHVLDK